MALKVPHCPMCRGATELKALEQVAGEDGPLKLTARGMPVFRCAKGHNMPVHQDFMIWLIREIKERGGQIPAGKEQGLLLKKHLCGACGKDLAGKPERRQAHAFDLSYEGLAPFKLDVEVPGYKCTACGREQMRSPKEVQGHAAAAIVGINDAAGFPHSG